MNLEFTVQLLIFFLLLLGWCFLYNTQNQHELQLQQHHFIFWSKIPHLILVSQYLKVYGFGPSNTLSCKDCYNV